jgi:hypothetical protein
MASWIIAAAVATIAITAALTWLLWRLNAPAGSDAASAEAGRDRD